MVEDKRQPPAKDAATSDETERDGQKADGDLGDLQFLLTETLFRTAWSILCEELCSTDLEV